MTQLPTKLIIALLGVAVLAACSGSASNRAMVSLLAEVAREAAHPENPFAPEAQLKFYDSIISQSKDQQRQMAAGFTKAVSHLQLGDEVNSIRILEDLLAISSRPEDSAGRRMVLRDLAMSYMRLGERTNCVNNHGRQSCVFPLQGNGIHMDKRGSERAIELYLLLLYDNKDDLESRWLLNVAYMTTGGYPQQVPRQYLIPGLDGEGPTLVKPFTDLALNIGMNTKNMAGGSIVDDFNNDGYLDIITSSWDLKEGMHYCRNKGDGSFVELSDSSGLSAFTGGLNIMQIDYNNDGFKDIFVLRGAWKVKFGNEPNSLLRNNGNGTFTDVTEQSGLLSFHPTQAATWNDFNNDGWIDVFIGNESKSIYDGNTSEFYLNNKNGTFSNVAVETNTNFNAYIKGVTSGDYDNDGWPDIFISTLQDEKFLVRNEGIKNGKLRFEDVTEQAGLGNVDTRTFPTWFWDYDNDGWLDLFICGYEFQQSLGYYAAAEALNLPLGKTGKPFVFRNKGNGTFEDMSEKLGLNKIAFSMGSNFGDINNDGYLDIYLGTGNPQYQSLVPNKMFLNLDGKAFADVTSAARVGNLQKGHAVSFADLDSDGDVDIYIDMGGAYFGDAYENSLYVNPGQNSNKWIELTLEGVRCNRAAIGARIKVTFTENGKQRSVYRDVNSGGSFGSNPLTQHIGIGSAAVIDRIEIKWPVTNEVQSFEKVNPGRRLRLKQGDKNFSEYRLQAVDFSATRSGLISCSAQ